MIIYIQTIHVYKYKYIYIYILSIVHCLLHSARCPLSIELWPIAHRAKAYCLPFVAHRLLPIAERLSFIAPRAMAYCLSSIAPLRSATVFEAASSSSASVLRARERDRERLHIVLRLSPIPSMCSATVFGAASSSAAAASFACLTASICFFASEVACRLHGQYDCYIIPHLIPFCEFLESSILYMKHQMLYVK